MVQVEAWAGYGWLRHGFSTRVGGLSTVYGGKDLNLGFTGEDDPELVRQNRFRFMAAVSGTAAGMALKTLRQVHATQIHIVSVDNDPTGGDGLMTSKAGVMLGILVADCVPILLVDVRQRVVAALHAGWRGTAAGMGKMGVRKMIAEFGSKPEDLMAAIGPSIGPCCYEVGEEVRTAFSERFEDATASFEGSHLDLWEANRWQLAAAGLSSEQIWIVEECTACSHVDGERKYFSHRAEEGFTGRAMGMIGIVEPV